MYLYCYQIDRQVKRWKLAFLSTLLLEDKDILPYGSSEFSWNPNRYLHQQKHLPINTFPSAPGSAIIVASSYRLLLKQLWQNPQITQEPPAILLNMNLEVKSSLSTAQLHLRPFTIPPL